MPTPCWSQNLAQPVHFSLEKSESPVHINKSWEKFCKIMNGSDVVDGISNIGLFGRRSRHTSADNTDSPIQRRIRNGSGPSSLLGSRRNSKANSSKLNIFDVFIL